MAAARKRTGRRVWLGVALAGLFALPARQAGAFKLGTHVWVAQQVLNDVVPDGRVTIQPFGELSVAPDVVDALRRFPDQYRMGSVGPDGFPDLVGGQMTVHPGSVLRAVDGIGGAWATDEWLDHLLAAAHGPGEKAFAYGYLSHASGDVFAHTYTNLYAGGVFNFTDGEVENELRHMALEGYLQARTPPLLDHLGQPVGHPADRVAVPAEFVRDTLILDAEAAAQYRSVPATVYLDRMRAFLLALDDVVATADDAIGAFGQGIDGVQAEIDALKDKTFEVSYGLGSVTVKLWPAYCFLDPGTCLSIELLEANLEAVKRLNRLAADTVKAPLVAWRNDVRIAIGEYVETSAEVARALLRDEDPRPALQGWACRYGSAFIAVPGPLSAGVCGAIDLVGEVGDLVTAVDDLQVALDDKLGLFGWLVNPNAKVIKLKRQLQEDLRNRFEDLAEGLIRSVAGEDSLMYALAAMRHAAYDDDALDAVFRYDESGSGFLTFDSVSSLVKADLGGDRVSTAFAPAHDAVVLSKLALLGPAALNTLVRRAGISRTIYGGDLYDPGAFRNILVGAVASIDGNHQWQETAPPHPRQTYTAGNTLPVGYRRYGYPFDGTHGFRLWQDCQVREKVFLRIFKGPLAPGLQSVLAAADPNRATPDDPFPLAPDSSLPLKVSTDDGIDYSVADAVAGGLGVSELWVELALGAQPLLLADPFALAAPVAGPGPSARDLVIDLDSQVCGGEAGSPIRTEWSFVADCVFECRFLGSARPPYQGVLRCTSPVCGRLPDIPLDELADRIRDGGFKTDTFDHFTGRMNNILGHPLDRTDITGCLVCHLPEDGLLGTTVDADGFRIPPAFGEPFWVRKRDFVPGTRVTTPTGTVGLEWDGALICDPRASRTNLVLQPEDSRRIRAVVTDPATGETAWVEGERTTDLPELGFSDWREVNDALLDATGGAESVCGAVNTVPDDDLGPDTSPPVLVPPPGRTLACGEVVRHLSGGGALEDLLGDPTVLDDRDAAPTVSHDAPATLPLGETLVTWTALDAAGNATQAVQTVTVEDTAPPVFDGVPPPAETRYGVSPDLLAPSAVDACDGPVTAAAEYPPGGLAVGDNRVGWEATDASGNTAVVEQVVTVVKDNADPQPEDDRVETPAGQAVTVAVLANDTDPEGDPLDLFVPADPDLSAGTPPEHGTVVRNPDGTVTYTPDPGYEGDDRFTYVATDGVGVGVATVHVTVGRSSGSGDGDQLGGGDADAPGESPSSGTGGGGCFLRQLARGW